MSALLPIEFKFEDVKNLKWTLESENLPFYYHVRNVCNTFPSLILGFSASPKSKQAAALLAESLLSVGINIFLPEHPTPMAALSRAIGTRGMPLALYLDMSGESDLCSVTAINNHGGPIDEKDIIDKTPEDNDRTGVVGQTELSKFYVNGLAELADPFIEEGIGFSEIICPFPDLLPLMKKHKSLSHLVQLDSSGPIAKISEDGQSLEIVQKDGKILETQYIVEQIGTYLHKERMAQGTIVGPNEILDLSTIGDFIKVNDNSFEMSYRAGFSDLFLGWWENGIIAHQGNSCFGDAFLSAIYLIEAWRSK